MKKVFLSLTLIMAFSIFSNNQSTFATEDKNELTETKLNEFLLETGAPNDLLERWGYEQKLELYNENKNDTLVFDTTETINYEENPHTGELIETANNQTPTMSARATITSKKLTTSHDIWTKASTGSKTKIVYANYSWNNTKRGGTKGDKLAIAVPSGWQVVANRYTCKEFQSGWPSSGYIHKASCGGKPYDLDFYGAVWNLTRTNNVWHQGWVSLEMKRTNKNAQNKVLSKYIEDVGKSTSWSVSWGPMSVGISGNKSANQVAWDTSFTY